MHHVANARDDATVTTYIEIWSDLHCPWAFVATHRLRVARDRLGIDVVFDQRAWPLEWVNGAGTPQATVMTEVAVLGQHEEDLFSRFNTSSWPSSFLGAFELVAAARRVDGVEAAEAVDYALRLAFFRDSVDVSVRAGLVAALDNAVEGGAALDVESILTTWHAGDVRADVLADYERGRGLPIQGSPQVFWPDGSTTHNPGMDDHEWVRGIPRLRNADPEEPERLLLTRCDAA